ncbi:hypothetical protein [Actinomadura montaniterrae]|uniref:YiaAB two helix domain-containing protein n=1 Tax=Actinomadura montaniterrae TaxID=1803903 RepID=A0A6L3VPC4_9ACTN|nr:hypothetical protein [Actinomadura montaniterrae]KAB2376963.1 hypothetical protein F9B16_24310 [Actinomadura montaniterrae]
MHPSPRWIATAFTGWTLTIGTACAAGSLWRGESLLTSVLGGLGIAAMFTALSVAVEHQERRTGPEARAERRRREAEELRRMVYGDEQPPDVPR